MISFGLAGEDSVVGNDSVVGEGSVVGGYHVITRHRFGIVDMVVAAR